MPQYSEVPLKRRHAPEAKGPESVVVHYTKQRDCLRLEFDFRCVYCLSHETEVARGAALGGFEIEHFQPKSRFRKLRHRYDNLLWACRACNLAKQATWPSQDLVKAGFRFVDPSREGLGKHLELSGIDQVTATTNAGRYVLQKIDLNSALHRSRRRDRRDLVIAFETIRATMEVLEENLKRVSDPQDAAQIEALIQANRRAISEIEQRIYPSAPRDQPPGCPCKGSPGRIPRYND